MRTKRSIPMSVLEKIKAHRPHFGAMIANFEKFDGTGYIGKLEKSIADAYLQGASNLTMLETWNLSKCVIGLPYGGSIGPAVCTRENQL